MPRRASPPALSSRSTTNGGGGVLIIFGLAFGTFGMLFAVIFFFWPLWQALDARSWQQTPCIINDISLESHTDNDGTTYSVAVHYTYRAADPAASPDAPLHTWSGERYSFATGSSSGPGDKQRAVDANPKGSERTCWVDPRHPERSVLVRDMDSDMWMGALTLLFPLVGYGLAVGGWWALRRQRAAAANGGAPTVRPGTGRPRETLALGTAQSPWTKLLLSLCVCAFWNGIVSVFLFGQLVPSFHSGHPEWLLFFFLIPFELIGLGLLLWVGYNLLALANPSPRLRISSPLRPGDRAQLSWAIAGSTSRLRRLSIRLEGREEATYSRGTRQVTDREPFHQAVLVDTDDHLAMQEGACELALPENVPASFAAAHNRLRWVVAVHGDIPRWPDIQQEWDLDVRPPPVPLPATSLVWAGNATPADDQTLAIRLGEAPDGQVGGEAAWTLPIAPTLLELRLFWYTSGRGTMDVGIAACQRLEALAASGRQTFSLALPQAPRPFDGKLVAITWALELVAQPGGQVVRLDLPAAPLPG